MEKYDPEKEYDKKYYVTSDAPMEYVYDAFGDDYQVNKRLSLVELNAKEAGFTGIKARWKAYVGSMQQQSNPIDVALHPIRFTKLETDLYVQNYYTGNDQIIGFDKNGQKVIVCNHPIAPVKILKNIETGQEKEEIWWLRRGKSEKRIVEKSMLSTTRSITNLSDFGVSVTSTNAQPLMEYLQEVEDLNEDKIELVNSVSRLGYFKKYGYCPYSKELLCDCDDNYVSIRDSMIPTGSLEEWIKAVEPIHKGWSIPARAALAASFASPLIRITSGLCFMVEMWGGTENGKTVTLMVASSVWGKADEYLGSLDSTPISRERLASYLNHFPLILDELQTAKDKRSFDSDIYKMCEGKSRGRGTKDGGIQRRSTWLNTIIVNGEQPIVNDNSGGGAINRVIVLECPAKKIMEEPQKMVDAISENYGVAGEEFISHLLLPGGEDTAKEVYKKYTEELSKITEISKKQVNSAAALLTGSYLADKWIFKDGIHLSVKDIRQYLHTLDDVNQNRKALQWLLGWISENKMYLRENNSSSDALHKCYGAISNDWIHIIKNVFIKECTAAGYNPESFNKWLIANGLVKTSKNRKFHRTTINGTTGESLTLITKNVEIFDSSSDMDTDFMDDFENIPF